MHLSKARLTAVTQANAPILTVTTPLPADIIPECTDGKGLYLFSVTAK